MHSHWLNINNPRELSGRTQRLLARRFLIMIYYVYPLGLHVKARAVFLTMLKLTSVVDL